MPRLFISSPFSLRMSIESWCSHTCLPREIISMGVCALQSWRKDDVFSNKNLASRRSSIEWKSNFRRADAMQRDKLKNISLSVWKDFVVCISPASLALLAKPFLFFFFFFIPLLVYLFKAFLSTRLTLTMKHLRDNLSSTMNTIIPNDLQWHFCVFTQGCDLGLFSFQWIQIETRGRALLLTRKLIRNQIRKIN